MEAVYEPMDSDEHPHPLINYSLTEDSDEESKLPQSNGEIDTTDDEDIPLDDHQQSGQKAQP